MTPELQQLIIKNPDRDELNNYIAKQGISTLFADGIKRVEQGMTTIEEVMRVVNG